MKYATTWTPEAENGLAEAWLHAPDRDAITAASHRLDRALSILPLTLGIPRKSSVNRIAVDLPLGIEFEIIEDDKKVRVLRVWSL